MTTQAHESPAPATGTAPGRISDTAKPDQHHPHIAAPGSPTTPTVAVPGPAKAPAKKRTKPKAKKKPAAPARPAKAPAKLDEEKLLRTPIAALRGMVRARKLVSGTDIIRLTKDAAINLLLGRGSTKQREDFAWASSKATLLGGMMPERHGELTVRGTADQLHAAIAAMRAAGIRADYSLHSQL